MSCPVIRLRKTFATCQLLALAIVQDQAIVGIMGSLHRLCSLSMQPVKSPCGMPGASPFILLSSQGPTIWLTRFSREKAVGYSKVKTCIR